MFHLPYFAVFRLTLLCYCSEFKKQFYFNYILFILSSFFAMCVCVCVCVSSSLRIVSTNLCVSLLLAPASAAVVVVVVVDDDVFLFRRFLFFALSSCVRFRRLDSVYISCLFLL